MPLPPLHEMTTRILRDDDQYPLWWHYIHHRGISSRYDELASRWNVELCQIHGITHLLVDVPHQMIQNGDAPCQAWKIFRTRYGDATWCCSHDKAFYGKELWNIINISASLSKKYEAYQRSTHEKIHIHATHAMRLARKFQLSYHNDKHVHRCMMLRKHKILPYCQKSNKIRHHWHENISANIMLSHFK